LFFEDGIGSAKIVVYPELPDRVFLHADYHMDLTKSEGMRKTLAVCDMVFEALKLLGLDEVYCYCTTPEAYRFNQYLGFEWTGESNEEHKLDIMRKQL
jgi:hypothetical protein